MKPRPPDEVKYGLELSQVSADMLEEIRKGEVIKNEREI